MLIAANTTSVSIDIQVVDDSGLAVTGLVAATLPAISWSLNNNTAATAISLSDLAAITTAYSSGGVKERSGGYYRLDIPNAALTTVGEVSLIGDATGKHVLAAKIIVGGTVTAGTVSDKTGYSLTQTFPANFSALAITAGGAMTAGTVSDKTGYSLSVTPPTAAQIVTTMMQDTTAGNYTTAGSFGKGLFTSGVVPGGAGGLALVGSNVTFASGTDFSTTMKTSLNAATPQDTAGTTTLLGRITSARAGYLDNLNVGGAVASHADVAAINQSASKHVLLQTVGQYEKPVSGTVGYTVECRTYSAVDGSAVNADSTPTLTATGSVSGSLSGNLSVVSNPATGLYRATYTVTSTDTDEQIRMDVSATIALSTFTLSAYTQVVELIASTFTTADRSNLTAIFNVIPAHTPTVDSSGRISANAVQLAGQTITAGAGVTFPSTVASPTNITSASGVVLADGSFTASKLPASGFNYPHGISLSSDQGTPGLSITTSGGFSALKISSSGAGAAISILSVSTGDAIDITGPSQLARPGDQMDLVSAPNTSAVTAIQNGLATATNLAAAKTEIDAIKTTTDQFRFTTPNKVDATVSGSGGLSGSSSVTLTFHDANNNPVQNVEFTIVGQGVGPRTNSIGVSAFSLNDGTYTVLSFLSGVTIFPQTTLVVSGTTTLTITGTSVVLPTPATGQVSAYLYIRDAHGAILPVANNVITFQLIDPQSTGDGWDLNEFAIPSDGTGLVTTLLQASAKYQARTIEGDWVPFTTSASGSYALPQVLGRL